MLTLFAGPTAHGLRLPDDVDLLPPVRRGDLQNLTRTSERGVVAIADGTFHAYPSVGHAEIRESLEAGWSVWGLSSMGAIRAAEMRHLGMRGFGEVYARYAADEDFDDDEVALIHQDEAPFRALSEPLIHLRAFVRSLEVAGEDKVIDGLKHRWYAERTLALLRELLLAHTALGPAEVERALAAFGRFRLKQQDLAAFLEQRPWADELDRAGQQGGS